MRVFHRGRPTKGTGPTYNVMKMVADYRSGVTTTKLAAEYGVSVARIHQILKKQGLTAKDGGNYVRVLKRTTARVVKQTISHESRVLQSWGLNLDEYKNHVKTHGSGAKPGSPMYGYTNQRLAMIRVHGKQMWQISFLEWWAVWQESGHWGRRGMYTSEKYCLTRIDRNLPFTADNVVTLPLAQVIQHQRAWEKANGRTWRLPSVKLAA